MVFDGVYSFVIAVEIARCQELVATVSDGFYTMMFDGFYIFSAVTGNIARDHQYLWHRCVGSTAVQVHQHNSNDNSDGTSNGNSNNNSNESSNDGTGQQ